MDELIKALRYCADEGKVCTEQTNCGYYGKGFFCQDVLMRDTADALEAADKRIAELMPKEGEWMFSRGDGKTCVDGWTCSACGNSFHTYVPYFKEFHFCPNCGAKMKGANDADN